MRCRAECCHRAATRFLQPTSPSVWIADDDLAHAFSRFVRLSSPNCAVQRRHGSNVPGPLESRRRLAKRRMMGLAQSCPPPMPDFGSLFGTTPVDVPSLWKPPTKDNITSPCIPPPPLFKYAAVRPSEPLFTSSLPPPPPLHRKLTIDNYAKLLEPCHTPSDINDLHVSLHPDGDIPVTFSKAILRRLLAQIPTRSDHTKTLAEEHFHPVARFLQGDLNHENARNTQFYTSWLSQKPISLPTFRAVVQIIADKILLGTIEHRELRAIIGDLQNLLKTGLSQPDRDDAFLYACRSITDAISEVPVLRADKHLCHALLIAACSLTPSRQAVPLILRTVEWAPESERHMHVPIVPVIGECLFVWARKTSRNNPVEEVSGDEALPSPLMTLLNSLPENCAGNIIEHATLRFISFINKMDTSPNSPDSDSDIKQRITYWLYLLRRCNHLRSQPYNGKTWNQLYPLLAQAFTLRELATHFASITPANAARLILQHWISPGILTQSELKYGGSRKADSNMNHFLNHGVSYTVSRAGSGDQTMTKMKTATWASRLPSILSPPLYTKQALACPEDTVEAIHSAFEARLAKYTCNDEAVTAPFADLVVVLQEHQLDHTRYLDQVLQLLIQYHSPQTIFTFFMKLVGRSDDKVFTHPGIAMTLIHFFIETGNHRHAYSVFKLCPGAWPSLCPELLFALIDKQPITTETLFKILDRPEIGNSLPINLRTEPKNSLSFERVNLIQHMAYALANSPHLTPRQAFRRVQDCLHYLEDRGAPLSSIMSRALVTAGVARYLQAGEWVSTVRFTWILPYVRRLEGEDVADMLDQMTFKWRSDNHNERMQGLFRSRELQLAKLETDREAWQYRRQLGHASKRWKRKQRLWKPWLADGKRRDMQGAEAIGSASLLPASYDSGLWKPWVEETNEKLDRKETTM